MKHFLEWFRDNNSKYAFATCSAVILYFLLGNARVIFSAAGHFLGFFSPVFAGVIIAYILNPMVKWGRDKVFSRMKNQNAAWTASVAATIIIVVIFAAILLIALIPQLVTSALGFLENMNTYVNRLQHLISRLARGKKDAPIDITTFTNYSDKLLDTLQDYVTGNLGDVITTSTGIGHKLVNFGVSFVMAIYFLNDKKRIMEYTGIILKKLIPEPWYEGIASFWQGCNAILIRYIVCEILDALIVGVSNFLFMVITGMPYGALISVVVGVTNLAPTFGPIVGGVIGTLILLLAEPRNALYFIIFTNVLQTIDGYVIKPRMYGDTLGISPILILISIIVGGRMFGVAGMVLGIPFAAIMDYAIRKETYLKDLAKTLNRRGGARADRQEGQEAGEEDAHDEAGESSGSGESSEG